MKTIEWQTLAGQQRVKAMLATACANGTLGHAYLFCGDEGYGTVAAAVELAAAVLCESGGKAPCRECAGCRKVASCSHPDLHCLFPVTLEKDQISDGTLKQKGWEAVAVRARERIGNPYHRFEDDALAAIPVDWIREVNEGIRRGAVSGATNVSIISAIDRMNKESANALLKTLEEPPAGTLILLCTERLHEVQPTIVSRCQVVRFGILTPEQISAALRRLPQPPDDGAIERILAESRGSLGRAYALAMASDDVAGATAERLWECLACMNVAGGWVKASVGVEQISEESTPEMLDRAFSAFLYDLRAAMLQSTGATPTYISHHLPPAAARLDVAAAIRAGELCERAGRAVRSRGNGALVLVDFLHGMAELLYGKQQ